MSIAEKGTGKTLSLRGMNMKKCEDMSIYFFVSAFVTAFPPYRQTKATVQCDSRNVTASGWNSDLVQYFDGSSKRNWECLTNKNNSALFFYATTRIQSGYDQSSLSVL